MEVQRGHSKLGVGGARVSFFALSAWCGIWLVYSVYGQGIILSRPILMASEAVIPAIMGLLFFDEIKRVRALGNKGRAAVIAGTIGALLVSIVPWLG